MFVIEVSQAQLPSQGGSDFLPSHIFRLAGDNDLYLRVNDEDVSDCVAVDVSNGEILPESYRMSTAIDLGHVVNMELSKQ